MVHIISRRLMACLIFCIKHFIEGVRGFILVVAHKFKRVLEKRPTPHRARQLSLQEQEIWGMDIYKNRAHDFLESECPCDSVLGFWGTTGVGKHTLLSLILLSYCWYGYTPFRYVMLIGRQARTVEELQSCIASFLQLDLVSMSSLDKQSRAKVISNHLEHASFLVMLHDVQDCLDLTAIGLPLRGRLQKVIFTTRSEAVCASMAHDNSVEMRCLGEDDAWNLFIQYGVYKIIDGHPEIHDIAKELSAACGGLPRALCRVGAHMSDIEDVSDWRYIYHCFKTKSRLPGMMRHLGAFLGLPQKNDPK